MAISARLAKFSQYTVLDIIISSMLTACMNVIGVRSTVCGLYMHLTRPLLDLVFFCRGLARETNAAVAMCILITVSLCILL